MFYEKFISLRRVGFTRALAITVVVGLIFAVSSYIGRAVGAAQHQLAATLSAYPQSELMPGVIQSYSLKITNSGKQRLNHILACAITDNKFQLISAAGGEVDAKGNAALWKIAELAPQESVTISFMGRLTGSAAVGDILNLRMYVSSDEVKKQTVIAPVIRVAPLPENASAQLETFQTADPITAQPGQEVLFHIVVHNRGLLPAEAVSINEQLPRELELLPETMHPHLSSFATSTQPQLNYNENAGLFQVKVDALNPGDWAAIMLRARVRAQARIGEKLNFGATVAAKNPQWQSGAPIQIQIGAANNIGDDAKGNVSVNVKVDKSNAMPGDKLTYTITVANNGAQSVGKLKIMDMIPQGLSLVSGSSTTDCGLKVVESSGQVLWKKGTLPAAANGEAGACAVGFQATVAADAVTGTITNAASVKGTGVKTVTGNAQTSVQGASTADIDIVDFAFNPMALTVSAGTVITWTQTGNSIHTVTSDSCSMLSFNSDDMSPSGLRNGDKFSFAVPADAKSGTVIYYHCRFHGSDGNCNSAGPGMTGMIMVQ